MNNISPFRTKKGKKGNESLFQKNHVFFKPPDIQNVETDQSLYLARPQCDMNNYRSLTKGCMKLISFFQNDLQPG
jgi:hypothetical protein